MQKKTTPSFFTVLLLLVCLNLTLGCAGPVVKMAGPMPDLIKTYKSVTILASQAGLYDSGVQVNEGDYVSLLANGTMDIWPGRPGYSYGPDFRILVRVGERDPIMYPFRRHTSFSASDRGSIYVGYRADAVDPYTGMPANPSWYKDDIGSYQLDIIVWKKNDPVLISNFLEDLSSSDHQNKALHDLAGDFSRQKEIVVAERKIKGEVEKTTEALAAIEEGKLPYVKEITDKDAGLDVLEKKPEAQAPPEAKDIKQTADTDSPEMAKEKQIAILTERLQKALQSMHELEEMKKRMAEQQKKEAEMAARLDALETAKMRDGENLPVIAIASPQDGMTADYEYVVLTGVTESTKGIAKLEIMVNQKHVNKQEQRAVKIIAKDRRRVDFSERIHLQKGDNDISIIAHDDEGLVAEKKLSIHFSKKQGDIWAVVIGISKYKNIPSLKYAANDARQFYRYLNEVNGVPQDHLWLLLDEEATLDNLRSTLGTQLRRRAGKEDTVIIFLAGHGATEKDAASLDGDGLEKYILPHNTDPKDYYASALPMREIAHIFQRINAERLVFISDTCYSGASGGRTIPLTGTRSSVSNAFLERLLQGKGRVIITASDANEVSIEKDELKHGVFSYYLLEGLRGAADRDGDGIITVDEVYRYVSVKVPQATGQDQHPVKKGEMTGEIVLGVIK